MTSQHIQAKFEQLLRDKEQQRRAKENPVNEEAVRQRVKQNGLKLRKRGDKYLLTTDTGYKLGDGVSLETVVKLLNEPELES